MHPTMSSGSVGYYPPPPRPGPILPPLPVNSFNLHHHEHYNRGNSINYHLWCIFIKSYYNISDQYGSGGYKSGECPRIRSSSYTYNRGRPQSGYRGDQYYYRDTSPGRDSCSYDYDCPGREKCCLTEVNRSVYSMTCRYPIGSTRSSRDRYYYKK